MNNCSAGSDAAKGPHRQRAMGVGVLSLGERAYLVGLYFADGTMRRHRKTSYELGFALQGDEMEIAERIGGMFRRSGLNPGIRREEDSYVIRVTVIGTNLVLLFPVKVEVGSMGAVALRWIKDEGVEVPFIAGLLDGDGNTRVYYNARGAVFGYVCRDWSFAQTKFPFLVEFVDAYVNSLAAKGASLHNMKGARVVAILASGREALLHRGIGEWSYKVKDWLRRSEKLDRWLANVKSSFLTAGQVARRLRVSQSWVVESCRRGRIKHILIRSLLAKGKNYFHIIPVEEVERLEHERREGGDG